MDDVQILGDDLRDIIYCLKAAFYTLLNRDCKSTIFGLGSWARRLDLPLQWLLALDYVKVLGLIISPVFCHTVHLSWACGMWHVADPSLL